MDENAANGQARVPITKIKFRNLSTKEATKITSRPNEAVEKVFSSAHSAVNQTGYQES
jgi:hypothetical protein